MVELGEWADDPCRTCGIQGELKDKIIECPECGAFTCHYRCRIREVSYYCDTCKNGPVTTYYPPCYIDREIYGLYPEIRRDESLKSVAATAKLFHIRYNQLFLAVKEGKKLRFRGSVKEMVEKMQALDQIGIIYRVAPLLPYSLLSQCMKQGII